MGGFLMAKIKAAQVKELRDRTSVGMMDAKNALVETDGDMEAAITLLREQGLAAVEKKAGRIAAEGLSDVHVAGNVAAVVEVNSETDFVSKNEEFQKLVKNISETITANDPADMDEAMQLDMNGETIEDAITNAINTIGEKITFRRFARFEKEDSQHFGPYIHMNGEISALTVVEGGDENVARDIAMHVAAINPRYLDRSQVPEDVKAEEKNILVEQAKQEGKPENIVEKMVEGRMNKWLGEISLVDQDFVKNPDQTVQQYLDENNASVTNFVRFEVGEGIEKREEDFAEEVKKELNK